MKPHFVTKPKITFAKSIEGVPFYSMDSDLVYWNGKKLITIKHEGFLTNLASIPKWLHFAIKPNRLTMFYASILHDGLYGEKTLSKRVLSDWTYLQAMKADGENFFIRWSAFLAVRAFGSEYY